MLAISLFGTNEIIFLLWSSLFFKPERPDWALAEVVFLRGSILALVVGLAPISRTVHLGSGETYGAPRIHAGMREKGGGTPASASPGGARRARHDPAGPGSASGSRPRRPQLHGRRAEPAAPALDRRSPVACEQETKRGSSAEALLGQAPRPSTKPGQSQARMSQIQLLLVEDEAILHLVLEEALSQAGFEVLIAANGTEAIAHLDADAERFKGVVTDIRLGAGPNGWDIGHRARELVPYMPVLYMSGDSGAEWTSKGVPNSVMLGKPFAMAQVVIAISQLINEHTPPTA